MGKRLLTIKEAATALGVSEKTALKYAREERIIIVNPTDYHSYKVRASSVDAYIEGRSPWHAKQRRENAASAEKAPSATARPARSRGKRNGRTPMDALSIEDFKSGRRLRRG